jgi:hypothetical protein
MREREYNIMGNQLIGLVGLGQSSTRLSNLPPTPEEIAAVLRLGRGEYFQQLASQILEMGIDGKQLKEFFFLCLLVFQPTSFGSIFCQYSIEFHSTESAVCTRKSTMQVET